MLENSMMILGVAGAVLPPVLIVILCAVAAVGTLLLLPSRREPAIRKIGGTIVAMVAVILGAALMRHAAGQSDPMGFYFWAFAVIALFGSLRVVTHPRPVYSALYFVLTVFASAGLFVLLWAEFMAAALVLIYAGAILVTYVFVIMLAGRSSGQEEATDADLKSREPLAVSIIGCGLMAMLLYVIFDRAPSADPTKAVAPGDLSVQALAEFLFRNHLVSLELAGVLLTMAMVGAIIIARRRMWSAQPQSPATEKPIIGEDNPHAIPVAGTTNPRQKAYPEA